MTILEQVKTAVLQYEAHELSAGETVAIIQDLTGKLVFKFDLDTYFAMYDLNEFCEMLCSN